MAEEHNPGENPAPPAEPAASAALVEPAAPNGSEPENNAGGESATVPSARLREETEKRRKAEEENARLQQELEASQTPPPPADDELEPDVEKLLDNYAKKRGLVSETELAAERQKIQVQQDVRDLESAPPVTGIPYDHQDVMEYAKSNGLPITSKAALKAAYKELNWDKIVEAERQKAIDGYKTAGSSGAESPGSGGAIPPEEPKLEGKSPKERTRERIALARQRLSI